MGPVADCLMPPMPALPGWGDGTRPVQQILFVTFPFFALELCGYLAARSRMLPLDAIPGLNGFNATMTPPDGIGCLLGMRSL